MNRFLFVFVALLFLSCNYYRKDTVFSKRKYLPRFKTERQHYEQPQQQYACDANLYDKENVKQRAELPVDQPLKPYVFQHLYRAKISGLTTTSHRPRKLTRLVPNQFFSPKAVWYEGEDDDYVLDDEIKLKLLKKQIFRLLLAFALGLFSYVGIAIIPFFLAYKIIVEYDDIIAITLQRIGKTLFLLNFFFIIVSGILILLLFVALVSPSVMLWLLSIPSVVYINFFLLMLIVWLISFLYAVVVLFHLLHKLNKLKNDIKI